VVVSVDLNPEAIGSGGVSGERTASFKVPCGRVEVPTKAKK